MSWPGASGILSIFKPKDEMLDDVPTNLTEIKPPTIQVGGHLEEILYFRDT